MEFRTHLLSTVFLQIVDNWQNETVHQITHHIFSTVLCWLCFNLFLISHVVLYVRALNVDSVSAHFLKFILPSEKTTHLSRQKILTCIVQFIHYTTITAKLLSLFYHMKNIHDILFLNNVNFLFQKYFLRQVQGVMLIRSTAHPTYDNCLFLHYLRVRLG